MIKQAIRFVLASSLMLAAVDAHAFVGDRFNLNGPGSETDGVGSSRIYARKADGSIWMRQIDPIMNSWTSLGTPPSGTTSGPQAAIFYASPTTLQPFVIVRGGDGNIWERHFVGSAWTAWSSGLGQPPGGSTSAPAIASNRTWGMELAVLGSGDQVWVLRRYSDGSNSGWSQAGTLTSSSSPGVAITQAQTPSVFGTNSAGVILWSQCAYGGCFSSWTSLGGQAISGVTAAGNPNTNTNPPSQVVVTIGTNSRAYIDSLNQFTWDGWPQVSNYTNIPTNTTPSVMFAEGASIPQVTILGTDGNYLVANLNGGSKNAGRP